MRCTPAVQRVLGLKLVLVRRAMRRPLLVKNGTWRCQGASFDFGAPAQSLTVVEGIEVIPIQPLSS